MKKIYVLIAGMFLFLTIAGTAFAHVDVGIGVNIVPPPVAVPESPVLVPIPGRYVYVIPDLDVDILYYHGWWYRPYERYWFRSKSYRGPWQGIRTVPPAVLDLPPDYRSLPPGYERVPYGQVRQNWKKWERERYWDRRGEESRELLRKGEREREREEGREREHERGERY